MQLRIPGTFHVIDLQAKIADEFRRGVRPHYHFNGVPLNLHARR